jgi:hypothetical protein
MKTLQAEYKSSLLLPMARPLQDHRRLRAAMLVASRGFLERLVDTERRYHVSREVRGEARRLLRCYPSLEELQRMAAAEYGTELGWTPEARPESQS